MRPVHHEVELNEFKFSNWLISRSNRLFWDSHLEKRIAEWLCPSTNNIIYRAFEHFDKIRLWVVRVYSAISNRDYFIDFDRQKERLKACRTTRIVVKALECTFSGAQVRFPLYDAHGNGVATLGRSGSSWNLADERAYDAWGRVRQGNLTGPLSARYCASLGHVQDDESGLVYMRARYYEPGMGRFISQDKAKDGLNWFTYCNGDPVNHIDQTGNNADLDRALNIFLLLATGAGAAYQVNLFWASIQCVYGLHSR